MTISKMYIHKIISYIKAPKLYRISKKSEQTINQIKNKYLFQSQTMKELFTDAYEYKGNEKGIIYIKNRLTQKPTPVIVKMRQSQYNSNNTVVEDIDFINPKTNKRIAHKHYYIKSTNGKHYMYPGKMQCYNPEYAGAGIRMDQIQIERALQLGVENIPRVSFPQAILYHLKMGFLPTNNYQKVTNFNKLKNYAKENHLDYSRQIPYQYFTPILIEKDGRFHVDRNWTIANACIKKCQEILEKNSKHRILHLDKFTFPLNLSGKELVKWKKIIEKYPILNKLNPIVGKTI